MGITAFGILLFALFAVCGLGAIIGVLLFTESDWRSYK